MNIFYIFSSPIFCSGELLETVQTLGVFDDSKQFVDMPLNADPGWFSPNINTILSDTFSLRDYINLLQISPADEVLMAFNNWTNRSKEGMKEFVSRWFEEAGSDIEEWTPVDWTSRLHIHTHIHVHTGKQTTQFRNYFR